MAYTTTDIPIVSDAACEQGRRIRVLCPLPGKVVQMYAGGRLQDARPPAAGACEFFLPDAGETDVLFFLAVDPLDAWTDFWDEAPGAPAGRGNRIRLRLPAWMTYGPHDAVEFYRGRAGEAEAEILVRRQDLFPGGRGAAGFGLGAYGRGGYGHDGANCPGYGQGYGRQYGFGWDEIVAVTESLPPGVYPVRVVVKDRYGNESPAGAATVALRSYARPACGLAVSSYAPETGSLVLHWTASPDV